MKKFTLLVIISLSVIHSFKAESNMGKFTANLYCKKSGSLAGVVRSYRDPSDFHWEDIPVAVLRYDVFGDTLDVERAMSDILKWPGTRITQDHLNTYLKDRMPFIKVEYTSGGSTQTCTDGKPTENIIYKGFNPETIAKFPANDKTVNFSESFIPLESIRSAQLECLVRGSTITSPSTQDPIILIKTHLLFKTDPRKPYKRPGKESSHPIGSAVAK